ncbi:hypothetical protein [Dictyobacter halimunensis]|uniref:hypothetical protein n=1 Tax=Dictyobacter halimunensis TaxID=3026934 RepID=UPI0030C6E1A9
MTARPIDKNDSQTRACRETWLGMNGCAFEQRRFFPTFRTDFGRTLALITNKMAHCFYKSACEALSTFCQIKWLLTTLGGLVLACLDVSSEEPSKRGKYGTIDGKGREINQGSSLAAFLLRGKDA